MRLVTIGLAILVSLSCAVNAQAQSGQASATTTRASILGGGAGSQPPQPGPPPNASAEFLVQEGNALLAAGYLDAALQDFQRAVNVAPDSSPTVSKGWYGLARVYMAQGNLELAKTSLEEVLSRNNDPDSVNNSRRVYGELKGRADLALSQAQQQLLYLQWRYHSVSFLNFVTKYFAWRDLRNAEKAIQQAQTLANSFNPRYLIAPVGTGAAPVMASEIGVANAATLPTEGTLGGGTPVTGVNTPAPGESSAASASTPAASVTQSAGSTSAAGQGTPVAQPAAQPAASVTASTPAAPADDLKAKRESYLTAYRNLQTAMGSRDAAAIQAATKAFQEAMKAYETARNRAASQ